METFGSVNPVRQGAVLSFHQLVEIVDECMLLSNEVLHDICFRTPFATQLSNSTTLLQSITQCDVAIREELYVNVMLSGGTTRFSKGLVST